MKVDKIYEVMCYHPGERPYSVWVCKSEETAKFLRDWEQACEYSYFLQMNELGKSLDRAQWSWETYAQAHAGKYTVEENWIYE